MAKTLRGRDPKTAKPSKLKMLIYGPAKVGKTWISLEWPGVYYIDTEGGANLSHYTDKLKAAGGLYLGPEDGAQEFDTVIDEVMTLATTKHHHKTLVIDSFSKLFNTQIASTEDAIVKRGDKLGFSVEKKEAIQKTRRLIMWLLNRLDMNVILICHQKDKWHKGEVVGQTFDGWEKLDYELNLMLQIQRTGTKSTALVTLSRFEEFPMHSPPFEWSFPKLAEMYGKGDLLTKESEAIRTATPDQVASVTSLVGKLKLEDGINKLLESAKVETLEDVLYETADEWVKKLTKRVEAM